ncbi:MAG: carboxypeptidase-like regulatory domain-containing protein, partial [Planctomycetes bacterium]|nr:carboxypeptidase-like regulatory domain-containing protein [Planctomycetota bacterium]
MNKPKPLPLLVLALALAIGFSLLLSQSGGDAGGGAPTLPSAVGVEEASESGQADLPELSSGGESRDIAPLVVEDGPSHLQPEALSGLGFAGRTDNRIRGRVVDPSGSPVEGAMVSVQLGFEGGAFAFSSGERGWVETDADGQFEAERVVFDQLSVEVRATGYAKLKETVPFRGEDLGTFELEPGVIVRGVVVDAQGLPVEDAGVSFRESRSELAVMMMSGLDDPDSRSAADGSFELDTGLVGPWEIEARHKMHPAGTLEGESDRAGLHPELVTIRLPQ